LETINHDVLVEILGPRPFQSDSYREYMKHALDKLKPVEKTKEEDEPPTPSLLSPAPA